MEKIGIFYGTTTGKTGAIIEEIEFNLRKSDYEVRNVADGIEGIEEFKNLILVSPSYGVGELQDDWLAVFDEFKKVDFTDKVVGIVGLGNQYAFGETFVGAMKHLYDAVVERGAKVVGFTSTEGYHYEECESVIGNEFVGLALDEANQDDETPKRIEEWIDDIKKSFI